jgi:hypothetical protein
MKSPALVVVRPGLRLAKGPPTIEANEGAGIFELGNGDSNYNFNMCRTVSDIALL